MSSSLVSAAVAAASGGGPEAAAGGGAGGANNATSKKGKERMTADKRFYSSHDEQLKNLKDNKAWMNDPIFFKSVAVSPSAITKMMQHCASGVEKGISKGGNPIEVMGLLLGRPDPTNRTTLIVADAFPLPIEGFETRVVADDQDVVNHMISLTDCLGVTRKEHIMGWYHSHPFDLEPDRSHCFLSQTDLSTQLLWQRAEDPQGNPFVAIVLDPLRSQYLGQPQLKAFRAFPPEYSTPVTNQCPDGTVVAEEQVRLENWGSCWNRYYELNIEYYMSSVSRQVLGDLTQNYLWMKGFQRSSETTKVKALETIASDLNKKAVSAGTRAGSSAGLTRGGSGGKGTEKEESIDSSVSTMRSTATEEITQAQLRQIQKQVFQKPISKDASTTGTSAASASASA